MDRSPLVSVIMPTYQRAWVIERAIASVLAQTYANIELLIIDNGSTDNTADTVKRFPDQRINYLVEPIRGVSNARNHGLKAAKGTLIAYLDSDNSWTNDYLETMIEAMEENVSMAYCGQNLLLVGKDKKVIARRTRNQVYDPVYLLRRNFIDLNCLVHRKDILRKIGGFDPSLSAREDWDLIIRIVLDDPLAVRHIDQVLCNYYHYLPEAEADTNSNQSLPASEQLNFYGIGAKDQERTEHLKRRLEQHKLGSYQLDTSF